MDVYFFAPSPKITQHFDNLVVMDTPSIPNYETSLLGQLRICRKFYQSYKDEFDMLLIISNLPWGSNEYWSLEGMGSNEDSKKRSSRNWCDTTESRKVVWITQET